MSKARSLADLGNVYDDGALSNRNLIINGAMTVAQRGTSSTSVSSAGYYACDRYRAACSRTQYVCTVSQDTSAPNGFASSYKITTTTAETTLDAGDQVNVSQRLEGQGLQRFKKGTADAEQFTVSFWVKSSIATTWSMALYDNDNTRQCSKTYTTNAANTWEYKTITFPADTTGSFDNDSAASLYFRFWLDGGTNYTSGTQQSSSWASYTAANEQYASTGFMTTANSTWQITGVQLEVGDTATPFEHRSYGDELARCQRYYYRIDNTGMPAFLRADGATTRDIHASFPTTMRANPTVTASVNGGTFSNPYPSTRQFWGRITGNNDTAHMYATDPITFDAEL